jgi:hypothetical protein
MKIRLTLTVLAVLGFVLLAFSQRRNPPQQSKSFQPQMEMGRFSMVPGSVDDQGIRTSTMYVIDTRTGRAWYLLPSFHANHKCDDPDKTGTCLIPEHFEPVPFAKYNDPSENQTEYPQ